MKSKNKLLLSVALFIYAYALINKAYPWMAVFSGFPMWMYLIWYGKNATFIFPNKSLFRIRCEIIGTSCITFVVVIMELYKLVT